MKVAFVYDHVNKIGGAERILQALHELYPDAPLYTVVADKRRATWAHEFELKTSFLQTLPWAKSFHEFFPVLPLFAVETFDFSSYELVVSVTSAEAKGIIVPPQVLHICYLLTPTRYLWSHYDEYFKSYFKILSLPFVSFMRIWDQLAAVRPDAYLSISQHVAYRTQKYYRRSAQVVYPPVDTDRFVPTSNSRSDYFLCVSRLVGYKRIDIAIDACNRLRLRLTIVGAGLAGRKLKLLAGSTIKFIENLTDGELIDYYQNCRALIFPQEEDFGIAAVEALACGKPVIAFKGGGALETVQEGFSGEFFSPQTSEALCRTLDRFMHKRYSSKLCRAAAIKYSKRAFKRNFAQFIDRQMAKFSER